MRNSWVTRIGVAGLRVTGFVLQLMLLGIFLRLTTYDLRLNGLLVKDAKGAKKREGRGETEEFMRNSWVTRIGVAGCGLRVSCYG